MMQTAILKSLTTLHLLPPPPPHSLRPSSTRPHSAHYTRNPAQLSAHLGSPPPPNRNHPNPFNEAKISLPGPQLSTDEINSRLRVVRPTLVGYVGFC